MKLGKRAGKIAAVAATAIAAATAWSGGTAHAQPGVWGEIRPVANGIIVQTWPTYYGPQCLALNGSDGYYNDHTRVIQWTCSGNDDQQWATQYAGSWYGHSLYQVVNKKSGKCMEVGNPPGNGTILDNGVQIDQVTCGSPNVPPDFNWRQVWYAPPIYPGSEYHSLVPLSAMEYGVSQCLDVDAGRPYPGTKVQQWSCHGATYQEFTGAPLYFLS
jgi:Ricin-type beta-trefoil lectin domain-like